MLNLNDITKIVFGLVSLFLVLILTLFTVTHAGLVPANPTDYNEKALDFTDCNDRTKAELDVRVADSQLKKYTGLSNTESLDDDSGMLFKYRSDASKTIVMRNMDIPIDIIFVGESGTVEAIESLDEPENVIEYYFTYDSTSGSGKYIIEANKDWTGNNDIQVGDCVKNL